MDNTAHTLNLRVPQQTLTSLSFADSSEKGIIDWIANLPKANIGETARQLYQGLIELNQLQISPDKRMAMLEQIRPGVHYVCSALARYYLGQSIVLEDRPRKVANLSQSLQNHLANGYKIVVAHEEEMKNRDRSELMSLAIQRAIRALSGPLLRAYQLYCPVADGVWLEIHQLYLLARKRNLHQAPINDPESLEGKHLSIERAYLTVLLMGTARPNQIRQSTMAKLFARLEDWSSLVELVEADSTDALFIINLDMDCPPRYRSLVLDEDLTGSLGLDTRQLVDTIKQYLLDNEPARNRLQVPDGLGVELLQHVSQSWGDLAERTFNRMPGRGELRITIGMSATHFQIAGKSFSRFMNAEDSNPFSDNSRRAAQEGWGNAFDGDKGIDWAPDVEKINYHSPNEPSEEENAEHYPIHHLRIVNHSPGGFCLTWPREVPKQLQAGELLGVQEQSDQGWSLAVVRWIRQVRGGGTQMGIELIAPHCTPCAVKLLRKTEQPSRYLRALLLPEVTAIDRPPTLITPRLPFQVNNKVMLCLGGQELRAQLADRVMATGSFSQFEHQVLGQGEKSGGKSENDSTSFSIATEDDFDSLWKSL
ncbi:MAG TPA: molecular chaperone [Candidatus Pseudomonas excrementavium]|uniref:molecular chaperone n=1 Tax=Halopseudomonas bauzanensis TaxID=653930 RepID=UPI001C3BF598|nr:molecular chaperone [Halopseudomonas bauzanensis]HIZ50758.1 molecular chaperone [Candidatus Pseudomonas excrementavium]